MARGRQPAQVSMLAFLNVDERVPPDHPLRPIKRIADRALAELSPKFDEMYAESGRPSIPPERLLKAGLLLALYTVRSERALCEALEFNLLYRWFLDMDALEPGFDATTFSKNRERLLRHEAARWFFDGVLAEAQRRDLLSESEFTIDGTLIRADASLKSFRPRGEGSETPPDDPGNPEVDFRGQRRSNATHASTTDPEARLARKGKSQAAELSYLGHVLMENRNGLVVAVTVTEATGKAERESVLPLVAEARRVGLHPRTVGADKGYDVAETVAAIEAEGITPHFARNTARNRRSAISDAVAAQPAYAQSQRTRKRVEETFGWIKTVGGMRRARYRGLAKISVQAYLVSAAYNLVRMAGLERRAAAAMGT